LNKILGQVFCCKHTVTEKIVACSVSLVAGRPAWVARARDQHAHANNRERSDCGTGCRDN
jgi:hypothetical protein